MVSTERKLGAFFVGEYMDKEKIEPTLEMIICPNCKTEVIELMSNDTKTHKVGCKGCKRWLWINASKNRIEVKRIPERTSLSGCRYYI